MKTLAALIFLLTSLSRADVIITYTANCTLAPVGSQIDSGNAIEGATEGCSLTSSVQPSSGIANATFSVLPDASTFPIGYLVDSSVYAEAAFGSGPGCQTQVPFACLPASANLQVEILIELTTAGPVRPGVVQFGGQCGTSGPENDGYDTFQLVIDGTDVCANGSIPVMLGEELTLEFTYDAEAYASAYGGAGPPGSDNFDAAVFEADGTTPVTLLDVPEPSTQALVTLALLALCCASSLRTPLPNPDRKEGDPN